MPIRKYLAGATFDPETIEKVVAAYHETCTILNVHGPEDPLSEVVAKKVFSLASHGERDASKIARLVVADQTAER
jgi:hypothetical protein